jgi:hypothetical protein
MSQLIAILVFVFAAAIALISILCGPDRFSSIGKLRRQYPNQ